MMLGLRAGLTMFCGNSKVAIGSENLIKSDKSRHRGFLSRVLCDLPPLSRLRKYADGRMMMSLASGQQVLCQQNNQPNAFSVG